MSLPKLGDRWNGGYSVRPNRGTADPVVSHLGHFRDQLTPEETMAGVSIPAASGLTDSVFVAEHFDASGVAIPIGLAAMHDQNLNLVFVVEEHRGEHVGTIAAAILVARFFETHPDDIVKADIRCKGGRGVFARLGAEHGFGFLTHANWNAALPGICALVTPD